MNCRSWHAAWYVKKHLRPVHMCVVQEALTCLHMTTPARVKKCIVPTHTRQPVPSANQPRAWASKSRSPA